LHQHLDALYSGWVVQAEGTLGLFSKKRMLVLCPLVLILYSDSNSNSNSNSNGNANGNGNGNGNGKGGKGCKKHQHLNSNSKQEFSLEHLGEVKQLKHTRLKLTLHLPNAKKPVELQLKVERVWGCGDRIDRDRHGCIIFWTLSFLSKKSNNRCLHGGGGMMYCSPPET
jgi:hypothetical protein